MGVIRREAFYRNKIMSNAVPNERLRGQLPISMRAV
jgi:hypothetical protein